MNQDTSDSQNHLIAISQSIHINMKKINSIIKEKKTAFFF